MLTLLHSVFLPIVMAVGIVQHAQQPFPITIWASCDDAPTLGLAWSEDTYVICDPEWLHALTDYTYRQGDVHYTNLRLYEDGSINVDVVNIQASVNPSIPPTTPTGYCAAPQMGCTPDFPWFPQE